MGRLKYSNRPIVEELDGLSIESLSPLLKVYFDRSSLFFNHRDALPGHEGIDISMTTDPSMAYLSGTYKGDEINTYVQAIACPFGSHRFYFLCGQTGYRVTRLYLSPDGEYLSRFALEAVYRTQREHRGAFFLLSRSRDLRNRALSYERQGRKKRMKEFLKMAAKLETLFYQQKIGYFEKRSHRIQKRYSHLY